MSSIKKNSSENYGNGKYAPNSNCTNRIESNSTGVTFEIKAFHTENNYDQVIFTDSTGNYSFDGYFFYDHSNQTVFLIKIFTNIELFQDYSGPQVGDRFSFSDSHVDVQFISDGDIQYSGFSFAVVDGYEPINDISNLWNATRIINKKALPKQKTKKTE